MIQRIRSSGTDTLCERSGLCDRIIRLVYMWKVRFCRQTTFGIAILLILYVTLRHRKSLVEDVSKERVPNDTSVAVEVRPKLQRIQSNETIVLVLILSGMRHKIRFITLLKNILYYQGRFREISAMCSLNYTVDRNYTCAKLSAVTYNPLHIHLICDQIGREYVTNELNSWPLEHVELTFYDFETACRYVQSIPDVHSGGVPAMLKIAVPEIVDWTVKKVILLDTDLMFNENIGELWKEFHNFKHNQSIGGVLVQHTVYAAYFRSTGWPVYSRGINTGILLLDLEKLRQVGWHRLWVGTTQALLKMTPNLRTADQDIYNAIFATRPDLVYQLPCPWNVQVLRNARPPLCAVAWPVRFYDEDVCQVEPVEQPSNHSIALRIANVVHFCGTKKPENRMITTFDDYHFAGNVKMFDIGELRATFYRVYFAFRNLSFQCFY